MVRYNMLSEIHVNPIIRAWRFKLMIIRIYTFEVFGSGPFWSYTLADTAGNKTELIIQPSEAHIFRGIKKGEGNWIDIHNVEVHDASNGFRPVSCPFRFAVIHTTRIYPISPQTNHHYMEFKTIHAIKNTSDLKFPVDTMGMVFNVQPLEVSSNPKMTTIVFHIRDTLVLDTMFYVIERTILYFVATGDAAYAFQENYEHNMGGGVLIVVLKMWRISKLERSDAETWLKTYKGLSDFRINPRMREVDDSRRELAKNDMNVTTDGTIVPM